MLILSFFQDNNTSELNALFAKIDERRRVSNSKLFRLKIFSLTHSVLADLQICEYCCASNLSLCFLIQIHLKKLCKKGLLKERKRKMFFPTRYIVQIIYLKYCS